VRILHARFHRGYPRSAAEEPPKPSDSEKKGEASRLGARCTGEIPDQPVPAWDTIRYQGQPVALVAADHPETARRALEKIHVEYEVAGREYGVALPVTAVVDQMLLSMRQKGWSDEGHSALLRVIDDLSEHEIG